VNIKIAGKWMFIPLKMVLIGIDPYPVGVWSNCGVLLGFDERNYGDTDGSIATWDILGPSERKQPVLRAFY
jgi:hypothetical protein